MMTAGQPSPIIAMVVEWWLFTIADMAGRYGHFEEDALVYFVQERRGGSFLVKISAKGDCPYLRLDRFRRDKRKK